MAKYRPKQYVLYIYGAKYKACVSCYPQSRWELIKRIDSDVTLANKHTTIRITTERLKRN